MLKSLWRIVFGGSRRGGKTNALRNLREITGYLVHATASHNAPPGMPVDEVVALIMRKISNEDLFDAWRKGERAYLQFTGRRIDLAIESWREVDKRRA